jgi:hypothetical protein
MLQVSRTAVAQAPPPLGTEVKPAISASPAKAEGDVAATATRKWEFELHGGRSATSGQRGGSAGLPSSGSIVNGLMSVSSFYFGDGARLFNQSTAALPGNQAALALVPLDSILAGSNIERQQGGTFGARLTRNLNRRLAIEVTGDYSADHLSFTSGALTGIEATRASFVPALTRALGSASIQSAVTSVSTVNDRQQAAEGVVTGALRIALRDSGKAIPYVEVGAGAAFPTGTAPSAKLVGSYQLGSPAQILSADTVTLHYNLNSPVLVWTAGGGVKYQVRDGWGIRLDARARFYRNPAVGLVDATPQTTLQSTGAASFPLIQTGVLQFSTTAPLSGASLANVPVFTGNGLQTQAVVTAGLFWRF